MRCPEDTQRATATGILLPVGFSLWGKVVPSKELCNQPMAQPLVLPALLTLFVQVMMEQATRQICLGRRGLRKRGMKVQNSHLLGSQPLARLPCPLPKAPAQPRMSPTSTTCHIPSVLPPQPLVLPPVPPSSPFSATALLLPCIHSHSRAVGASPPSPGEFPCVRAP